jgi:hypothetical protein
VGRQRSQRDQPRHLNKPPTSGASQCHPWCCLAPLRAYLRYIDFLLEISRRINH